MHAVASSCASATEMALEYADQTVSAGGLRDAFNSAASGSTVAKRHAIMDPRLSARIVEEALCRQDRCRRWTGHCCEGAALLMKLAVARWRKATGLFRKGYSTEVAMFATLAYIRGRSGVDIACLLRVSARSVTNFRRECLPILTDVLSRFLWRPPTEQQRAVFSQLYSAVLGRVIIIYDGFTVPLVQDIADATSRANMHHLRGGRGHDFILAVFPNGLIAGIHEAGRGSPSEAVHVRDLHARLQVLGIIKPGDVAVVDGGYKQQQDMLVPVAPVTQYEDGRRLLQLRDAVQRSGAEGAAAARAQALLDSAAGVLLARQLRTQMITQIRIVVENSIFLLKAFCPRLSTRLCAQRFSATQEASLVSLVTAVAGSVNFRMLWEGKAPRSVQWTRARGARGMLHQYAKQLREVLSHKGSGKPQRPDQRPADEHRRRTARRDRSALHSVWHEAARRRCGVKLADEREELYWLQLAHTLLQCVQPEHALHLECVGKGMGWLVQHADVRAAIDGVPAAEAGRMVESADFDGAAAAGAAGTPAASSFPSLQEYSQTASVEDAERLLLLQRPAGRRSTKRRHPRAAAGTGGRDAHSRRKRAHKMLVHNQVWQLREPVLYEGSGEPERGFWLVDTKVDATLDDGKVRMWSFTEEGDHECICTDQVQPLVEVLDAQGAWEWAARSCDLVAFPEDLVGGSMWNMWISSSP